MKCNLKHRSVKISCIFSSSKVMFGCLNSLPPPSPPNSPGVGQTRCPAPARPNIGSCQPPAISTTIWPISWLLMLRLAWQQIWPGPVCGQIEIEPGGEYHGQDGSGVSCLTAHLTTYHLVRPFFWSSRRGGFLGGDGGKMRVVALEVAGPQYLEDVDMAEQVVWHSYTTQIYLQIIR